MFYKEKLRETLEVIWEYLPTLTLYTIFICMVVSNVLVLFFGRQDLESIGRGSFFIILGILIFRRSS